MCVFSREDVANSDSKSFSTNTKSRVFWVELRWYYDCFLIFTRLWIQSFLLNLSISKITSIFIMHWISQKRMKLKSRSQILISIVFNLIIHSLLVIDTSIFSSSYSDQCDLTIETIENDENTSLVQLLLSQLKRVILCRRQMSW